MIRIYLPILKLVSLWGRYSCSVHWTRKAWRNPSFSRSTAGLNSEFSFYYTGTQSTEAVEYTSYISAEGKTPPTSVQDMTLNNLMVRLAPVLLAIWEIQSASSLPSLPAPLWSRVLAQDRVLSMGQIKLFEI